MVSSPFTWSPSGRTEPSDAVTRGRDRRPTTSRFTGERAYLARWYEILAPRPVAEIRSMKPSEIASVLGLDVVDLVVAVPWTPPSDPGDTPMPAPVATVNPARRIRRMVEG